jgi:hypothetical protein
LTVIVAGFTRTEIYAAAAADGGLKPEVCGDIVS